MPTNLLTKTDTYQQWMNEVQTVLRSTNVDLETWQRVWRFDFDAEHKAGTKPDDAAMKANRFWWYRQNKSLNRECRLTTNCWPPTGHQGDCQIV